MTDGGAVIEHGSSLLGDLGCSGHSLTIGRAEPIDQRFLCVVEHPCRVVDRLVVGDLLVGAVGLAETGPCNPLTPGCMVEDLVADGTGVLHLENLLSVV